MTDTDDQLGLFTDIQDKAIYELPINEHIRNFLRLEFLFQIVDDSMEKTEEWDSRQCVSGLIEVNELISRTDIKKELVKELDRYIRLFQSFQKNPDVDDKVLDEMLNKLQDSHRQLSNPSYHPGHMLHQDELIASIRQRNSISGGTCNFDLPAYHHWLRKSTGERKFQLNHWADDLKYMRDAIKLVLIILRTGSETTKESAVDGFFQYSIEQNRPAQLIRILLSINDPYFPEISGGKHRFSVRFMEQNNTQERPSQIKRTVDFELQCCN